MKISNEVRVALLVIVSLLLLFFGYTFIKGNAVFAKENTFYSLFNSAKGITANDRVTLLGVDIGEVQKVEFIDNHQGVKITFELDPDISIPSDSKINIIEDMLGLSGPSLHLAYGKSAKMLPNGSRLQSVQPNNHIDSISKMLPSAAANLIQTLATLDSLANNVNVLVSGNNQHNLEASIRNLRNTMTHLNATTKRVDKLLDDENQNLKAIIGNANSIAQNLNNNKELISNVIANFSATSDKLAEMDVQKTLNNADNAIQNLNAVLAKINTGSGSMALLVNDPQLYTNLNQSAKDLDELIRDLKQNPKYYLPNVSVFGKKDKRKRKNDKAKEQ